MKIPFGTSIVLLLLFLNIGNVNAQTSVSKSITVDEAIKISLQNNLQLQVNDLEIQKSTYQIKAGTDAPKTGLFVENEDASPADPKGILKIGIAQNFEFPTVYGARKNVFKEQQKYAQIAKTKTETELKKEIRTVYYQLWYLQDKRILTLQLDSIFKQLYEAASLKVKTGESAGLEKISADAKHKELQSQLIIINKEIVEQQQGLMKLLNTKDTLNALASPLEKLPYNSMDNDLTNHPLMKLQNQNVSIANAEIKLQKQTLLPDFTARFFSQRLYGISDRYFGYSVTVGVPLFIGSFKNKIKVAQTDLAFQQKQMEYTTLSLNSALLIQKNEVEKNNSALSYYEITGLGQAEEIIKAATLSYRSGEISFADLSQYLAQAIGIRENYLDNLNNYNQSIIQFQFIISK